MSTRTLLSVAIVVCLLLVANVALAAAPPCNYSVADGNWAVPANWSAGVIPSASYSAVVSYGKSIAVDSDVSSSILGRLWVGFDDGTAYAGDGTLTVNTGAYVKSYNLGVGTHPGTTGYLYINGGLLEVTGADSYVGYSGADGNMGVGSIVQTGGTADFARHFYVGQGAYTQGTLTVTGDDSLLKVGSSYTLGIGRQDHTNGVVTLGTAGGSDTPEISVGYLSLGAGYNGTGIDSVGTFTAQGASVFSCKSAYIGGYDSDCASGVGNVFVKDNASFTVSNDCLVGRYGAGTFTQTGGSVLIEDALSLGAYATASGLYAISAGTLTVEGAASVGTAGAGEFKVEDATAMITWSGDAAFGANGTLSFVAGSTGVSGIVMDTDIATVDIDPAALLSFDLSAMSSAAADIVLIDNYGTDAITGAFSNYSEGDTVATFGDGSSYKLSYVYNAGSDVSAGNDMALVANAVPEPSTLALIATGLIGLLAYAWRKRK